jgi:membrane-associated phospholipid phosphatase
MPSFHMAGALMVLWSFRRYRRFLLPLAALNTLLMLGTVMTGAHYAVDLLGTAAMFLVSILAWRVLGERLLEWTITPRHAAAAQESS